MGVKDLLRFIDEVVQAVSYFNFPIKILKSIIEDIFRSADGYRNIFRLSISS